jgi:hypothetical protein
MQVNDVGELYRSSLLNEGTGHQLFTLLLQIYSKETG